LIVSNAVIIVAAGRGERARQPEAARLPKQYARLAGTALFARSLEVFHTHPAIDRIVVVIHPDDLAFYEAEVPGGAQKLMPPCFGGATRQASVRNGLTALEPHRPDRVLIHDAARPFVDAGIIDRVLAALETSSAVVAGHPVADTLKRADETGRITGTVDRAGLWRAQTPQGFHFAEILAAHRAAAAAGRTDFTDDAAVAEWHDDPVVMVAGSARNRKITTAEDLLMAQAGGTGMVPDIRTGTGFDVHRFAPGTSVWLCGIEIAHTHTLEGHSDADVGLHALTDALLGAIGDGDIGQHFPPSDARWKGAASHLFLADAARRVASRGGRISNVDVTLLCEAPKISPHREAMRARIAEILGIDIGRVGVKATTTEGLGFTGRREGIAAMAAATVSLPPGALP
jgi:2-C-methyl-D-erythritol 4-phosphate cytidylyltransferase/2-C-methyl-D-erythritol 2,4-cyclodiphosphate synthase